MLECDDLWDLGFLNLLKLAPEKNGRFWSFSTRLGSGHLGVRCPRGNMGQSGAKLRWLMIGLYHWIKN